MGIKVHSIRLSSMNTSITNTIFISHFKKIVKKRVPRRVLSTLWLQHRTNNHVLPISCAWEHHVGSLKRAKVVLISKVCFVKLFSWKIVQNIKIKLIICTWKFQNSLTTSWFGMTILYKPVLRSVVSVLSHSNHNLFWNQVHTTSRTLLCTCCRYRAGSFLDRLYWTEIRCLLIRSRLLI